MGDFKLIFLFSLIASFLEVTSGQGLMDNILAKTNTAVSSKGNEKVTILSQLAPKVTTRQQKRRNGRRTSKNNKAKEPTIKKSNVDETLMIASLGENKQQASTNIDNKNIEENVGIRERVAQVNNQVDEIAKEARGYEKQISKSHITSLL